MQLFLIFLRLWKEGGRNGAVPLGMEGDMFYFVFVWEEPVYNLSDLMASQASPGSVLSVPDDLELHYSRRGLFPYLVFPCICFGLRP